MELRPRLGANRVQPRSFAKAAKFNTVPALRRTALVNRETVIEADAVSFRQIGLGTAAGSVSGVPGTAAAAIAVGKTDLGVRPAIGGIQISVRRSRGRALVAGPVFAGVIDSIGERGAIG